MLLGLCLIYVILMLKKQNEGYNVLDDILIKLMNRLVILVLSLITIRRGRTSRCVSNICVIVKVRNSF